jgi:D-arabinose 1-dehydrogenase-like Zn-dependent alcohol dehydrogenase
LATHEVTWHGAHAATPCLLFLLLLLLLSRALTFGGSIVGQLKDLQTMLEFCGEHNVVSDVEVGGRGGGGKAQGARGV